MKIVVLLHTYDYRGDHSADVEIAQEIRDDETVQELGERLLTNDLCIDWVSIRRVKEMQ